MSKSEFCQLWLSCKDTVEADVITRALLDAQLVACVKQMPVSSAYRWKDVTTNDTEVLLVMQSHTDLFEEVEKKVSELHSYDTFVLECLPMLNVSNKAAAWLRGELKG